MYIFDVDYLIMTKPKQIRWTQRIADISLFLVPEMELPVMALKYNRLVLTIKFIFIEVRSEKRQCAATFPCVLIDNSLLDFVKEQSE